MKPLRITIHGDLYEEFKRIGERHCDDDPGLTVRRAIAAFFLVLSADPTDTVEFIDDRLDQARLAREIRKRDEANAHEVDASCPDDIFDELIAIEAVSGLSPSEAIEEGLLIIRAAEDLLEREPGAAFDVKGERIPVRSLLTGNPAAVPPPLLH